MHEADVNSHYYRLFLRQNIVLTDYSDDFELPFHRYSTIDVDQPVGKFMPNHYSKVIRTSRRDHMNIRILQNPAVSRFARQRHHRRGAS